MPFRGRKLPIRIHSQSSFHLGYKFGCLGTPCGEIRIDKVRSRSEEDDAPASERTLDIFCDLASDKC